MNAYYENLTLPSQEEYLRIPGTAEYWHELDVNVSAVLAGQKKPKDALDATASSWEAVTQRYGAGQAESPLRGLVQGVNTPIRGADAAPR